MKTPNILVTYLLWTPATVEPFLTSYHDHPAGIKHDFLIIDKGGKCEVPKGYNHVRISDYGFDFSAFGAMLPRSHDYDYLVKLNSTSLILADNWLLKLYEAIRTPDAGIAGSTGSWASARSMSPAPWRKLLYPPFPNPHLRATGFIIASDVFRKVWPRNPIYTIGKFRYIAEHGHGNLSRRIESLGLKLLVVDKNGHVWQKQDWDKSKTFRSDNQDGLLIADKQTIIYQEADQQAKHWMSVTTWQNSRQS